VWQEETLVSPHTRTHMSRSLWSVLLVFSSALFLFVSQATGKEASLEHFWEVDSVAETGPSDPLSVRGGEDINIQREKLERLSEEGLEVKINHPLVNPLQKEEVKGAALTHVMLQAYDTDGNGYLSPEEMAKMDPKVLSVPLFRPGSASNISLHRP